MTPEQEAFLKNRIEQLTSRYKDVGPFRKFGIKRTIDGMRKQLKTGVWSPHKAESN